MQTYRLTLRPESAFGTPLAGDTLFGHLCWALRWRRGEAELLKLLDGYTRGKPFAVLSDAFPAGLLPRPTLPTARLRLTVDAGQRKADKRRAWLPAGRSVEPLVNWLNAARGIEVADSSRTEVRTQNTIHRLTGTTGSGPFAPRQVERTVHAANARLEVYVVLDAERLDLALLTQAMADIGANGFGRDASTGLGKFALEGPPEPHDWPRPPLASHVMSLAPCAPVPEEVDAQDCFYQPLTRFARHGSLHVLTGQPFKRPVLLMRSGAVLALRCAGSGPAGAWPAFHGQGLGGVTQSISVAEPATVHQGYAPVVPLALPTA